MRAQVGGVPYEHADQAANVDPDRLGVDPDDVGKGAGLVEFARAG